MKFEDKVYLADKIYWTFINKLEDYTDKMVVKMFVIDNPDDEGTINTLERFSGWIDQNYPWRKIAGLMKKDSIEEIKYGGISIDEINEWVSENLIEY